MGGIPIARDACTADAPVSQPDGIPKRIVSNTLDQASPQWVGNDVSRCCFHIIFTAYRPVVISRLPQPAFTTARTVYRSGTSGFGAAHEFRQRTVAKLDQPVQMLRHHYPGQGPGSSFFLGLSERVGHKPAYAPIGKNGLAVVHCRREEVDAPGFSGAAFS
ncbi:hypothetical protein D3C86_1680020 [compost metagenome]